MVHKQINFEISALFHCPYSRVKKRGKFKANLSFDQKESFLCCLSSRPKKTNFSNHCHRRKDIREAEIDSVGNPLTFVGTAVSKNRIQIQSCPKVGYKYSPVCVELIMVLIIGIKFDKKLQFEKKNTLAFEYLIHGTLSIFGYYQNYLCH